MPYTIEWNAIATGGGAVATLIVGLGAVRAARAVGFKQAGIQAEQAAIASRQADIQHEQVRKADLNNKIQLFDRRMETYNCVKNLLLSFHYEPYSDVLTSRNQTFSEKMIESRFLFDVTVYEFILDVWRRKDVHRIDLEKLYGDEPVSNRKVLEERVQTVGAWAYQTLNEMHLVFAPFLDMKPNAALEQYEAFTADAAPTVI